MSKRWTPTPKRKVEVGIHKRSYGKVTPKKVYEICVREKRIPSNAEIAEMLKAEGIYIHPDAVKRAKRKLKAGATIDGIGTKESLEAQIEALRAKGATGELEEKEERVLKRFKRREERVTEETYKAMENVRERVEKATGIHAEDWHTDMIMDRIINPMLHDQDPFAVDEKGRQSFPKQVWSVLSINSVAGQVRAIQPRLMDKQSDEGVVRARYEAKWKDIHGYGWSAPRTYLRRGDWEIFGANIIERNKKRLSWSKYTVGQVVNLIGRCQIVNGMREKKEILMFGVDKLIMSENDEDWEITECYTKKNEKWIHIPMYLFKGLALKAWKDSPSLKDYMQDQRKRLEAELAKGADDETRDLRVFPMTYEMYREAIARARTTPDGEEIFKGAHKVKPHAFRRTHATWLRMCGLSAEQIAGDYPDATVGIGWIDMNTLKEHYMSIEEEELMQIRSLAVEFNVRPELERKYERQAGVFVEEEERKVG